MKNGHSPLCRCSAGTPKRRTQKCRHSAVWSSSVTADAADMKCNTDAAQPMVCPGSGLPALSKNMEAKILANEYIDYATVSGGSSYHCAGSRSTSSEEDNT